MARMAGAVVKPVKLSLPNFSLPRDELEAAFGPQTKLILVNSPHNPSGKVFDEDELRLIADLCIKHDVLVLSDEVRAALYNNNKVLPLLRLKCLFKSIDLNDHQSQ